MANWYNVLAIEIDANLKKEVDDEIDRQKFHIWRMKKMKMIIWMMIDHICIQRMVIIQMAQMSLNLWMPHKEVYNENTEEEQNEVNQLNKEIIHVVVQRDMDFLNESWAKMAELEKKWKDDEIACKDKITSNDDSTTNSFQEVLSRSAKKAKYKEDSSEK